MGRYRGPSCRLCRREGIKLFLKGIRCETTKCVLSKRLTYDKKPKIPGQHGAVTKKLSDYGTQLREKQKIKKIYGVGERQFRKYFNEVKRKKGTTGEELLKLVERRLDNVLRKAGFAPSMRSAKQYITHGHIMVSGKKVDRPSYLVKIGEEISIRQNSRLWKIFDEKNKTIATNIPSWLQYDEGSKTIKIISYPNREDIDARIQEQLVVEFYSR